MKAKMWDRVVFTDFSAPIRMYQDINKKNAYVWTKKDQEHIPRDVEHGVDDLQYESVDFMHLQ